MADAFRAVRLSFYRSPVSHISILQLQALAGDQQDTRRLALELHRLGLLVTEEANDHLDQARLHGDLVDEQGQEVNNHVVFFLRTRIYVEAGHLRYQSIPMDSDEFSELDFSPASLDRLVLLRMCPLLHYAMNADLPGQDVHGNTALTMHRLSHALTIMANSFGPVDQEFSIITPICDSQPWIAPSHEGQLRHRRFRTWLDAPSWPAASTMIRFVFDRFEVLAGYSQDNDRSMRDHIDFNLQRNLVALPFLHMLDEHARTLAQRAVVIVQFVDRHGQQRIVLRSVFFFLFIFDSVKFNFHKPFCTTVSGIRRLRIGMITKI